MSTIFQIRLYNFISDYMNQHQCSPSYVEMTEAMGISKRSKSLITRSLRALNKANKVMLRKEGRRIGITLVNQQLFLIGQISAGLPIEILPEHQPIDIASLLKEEHQFAFQVKGNSMIDEGIFHGDIIICKQTNTAKEGDIVIALIDQRNIMLKRLSYKLKGMITLIAANPNLKPRAYSPERVQIQGVYKGLVRVHA